MVSVAIVLGLFYLLAAIALVITFVLFSWFDDD